MGKPRSERRRIKCESQKKTDDGFEILLQKCAESDAQEAEVYKTPPATPLPPEAVAELDAPEHESEGKTDEEFYEELLRELRER